MLNKGASRQLDPGSAVVITLTLFLFVLALFLKGFTQGLLLEAAVFLVSTKLVIMSYKNRVLADMLQQRLDEIQDTLRRMESSPR